MRDLTEDTLADLHTLMAYPPRLRRGHTRLLANPPAPAAGAGYSYPIGTDFWERILAVTATLTTGVTAATRFPVLNYVNADGVVFNSVPLAPAIANSQVQVMSPDIWPTTPVTTAQTLSAEGSVTNPGATTNIAFPGNFPAGTYQVTATVYVSGTVTAADANNMQVTGNGTPPIVIAYPGVANVPVTVTATVTMKTAGNFGVQTVAAASGVAAVYNASIQITPVYSQFTQAQMPDLVLKPGWSVQLAVTGMQATDQLSAISVLAERYPSNWADGELGADEENQLRQLARELAGWPARM